MDRALLGGGGRGSAHAVIGYDGTPLYRSSPMSKIIRQAAPPLPSPGKALPDQLQESLRRSKERLRSLDRKLKDAEPGSSTPGSGQ